MNWPADYINKIVCGDCLGVMKGIPDTSIHYCITSPPYWGLRDYGVDGQLGLEQTPEEYVAKMVEVFSEVKRVLRDDGTLWLNLGDSYFSNKGSQVADSIRGNGSKHGFLSGTAVRPGFPDHAKPKDLVGIPWRVAFALQSDGWYLRSDIIWHKPNPMPESVTDRPTKAHEYIFLLSKSQKYYYDHEAIKEPCQTPIDSKARCGFGSVNGKLSTTEYSHSNETGKRWEKTDVRNKRSVWTVPLRPFKEAHFATYPEKLIEPCILAGCPEDGIILDPFAGSGTTGKRAKELGRRYVLIELNPEYVKLATDRLRQEELFGNHKP
jgi:DNA modification methylase